MYWYRPNAEWERGTSQVKWGIRMVEVDQGSAHWSLDN